ncbi:AmmeMemoRadiSam system protein B [Methylacidimicrobium sp. B4]|uniref:AmmeMemoRadiSam system protein B n=1 Tax=Methylacidimicrobium sp. B4 TaxID=2796139 RepID=UPI001A8CF20A|nr:AmmeMemoRadiSam system protein B [Methylacidimicrobium sp. B4]QSR83895.1 AmmeMemoRadiSam system protein B [Methylacidimicrobium sp. B4]
MVTSEHSRRRQAIRCRCAGTCYPADERRALSYFRSFFSQPGAAPLPPPSAQGPTDLLGVLSPHIDFRVSPKAYTHAFAPLANAPEAEVYLILGVGHRSRLEWSIDDRDLLTPLGRALCEIESIEWLRHQVEFPCEDPEAHDGEHSIEFPVVLLQALRAFRGDDRPVRFLPLLCSGLSDSVAQGRAPSAGSSFERIATALHSLRRAYGERMRLIVSIDGCHMGPRFGHPFTITPLLLRQTRLWEEELWRTVEHRDLSAFFTHLGREGNVRYFDGVGALALLLRITDTDAGLERTYYEQWFEDSDRSVVTFTSGLWRRAERRANGGAVA